MRGVQALDLGEELEPPTTNLFCFPPIFEEIHDTCPDYILDTARMQGEDRGTPGGGAPEVKNIAPRMRGARIRIRARLSKDASPRLHRSLSHSRPAGEPRSVGWPVPLTKLFRASRASTDLLPQCQHRGLRRRPVPIESGGPRDAPRSPGEPGSSGASRGGKRLRACAYPFFGQHVPEGRTEGRRTGAPVSGAS